MISFSKATFAFIPITFASVEAQLGISFPALAFIPSPDARRTDNARFMVKSVDASSQKPNLLVNSDVIKRAEICADNFGECSVEEMEELRAKLHTERLTNFLDESSGLSSALDPDQEVGHILLEEDLSLQLSLLRDEIGSVVDLTPNSIPGDDPLHLEDETVSSTVSDSSMFALGNGLPEALAICVAVLLITFAPGLVHN